MGTQKFNAVGFGVAALLAVAAPAGASNLADQFAICASRYATGHQTDVASVMLECTAADGKLSDCKVLEAPTPPNGYDKAALCAADYLPIGTRTGTVKVPFRFEPSH
ncbi:MAG: hypothetical protein KGJ78_01885 [Alphaproteobacteria bacterium]|nr:hypothetical protein [Alphaproteobacteria bacterium]